MSITPGIKRETRGVGLEPTKQQKLQEAAPVPREKKKKKKKKKSDIGDGFHGERVRCMCVQEICQAFFVQEATRKRGNTIMANAEYAGETGKESKTGISRA
jgi:hypothetical protein